MRISSSPPEEHGRQQWDALIGSDDPTGAKDDLATGQTCDEEVDLDMRALYVHFTKSSRTRADTLPDDGEQLVDCSPVEAKHLIKDAGLVATVSVIGIERMVQQTLPLDQGLV